MSASVSGSAQGQVEVVGLLRVLASQTVLSQYSHALDQSRIATSREINIYRMVVVTNKIELPVHAFIIIVKACVGIPVRNIVRHTVRHRRHRWRRKQHSRYWQSTRHNRSTQTQRTWIVVLQTVARVRSGQAPRQDAGDGAASGSVVHVQGSVAHRKDFRVASEETGVFWSICTSYIVPYSSKDLPSYLKPSMLMES